MRGLGTVLEKIKTVMWNFIGQIILALLPQLILTAAYMSQANILEDRSTTKGRLVAIISPPDHFLFFSSMASLNTRRAKATYLSHVCGIASILAASVLSHNILGMLYKTISGTPVSQSYLASVASVMALANGVSNSDTGGSTPSKRTSKLQVTVMKINNTARSTAMGVCGGWFVSWLYNLAPGHHHVAVAGFVSLAVALVAAAVNLLVNNNTGVSSTKRISKGQIIVAVLINMVDYAVVAAAYSGAEGWIYKVIPGYPAAIAVGVRVVELVVTGYIEIPSSDLTENGLTPVTSVNDRTLTNCDEDVKVSSSQDEVLIL